MYIYLLTYSSQQPSEIDTVNSLIILMGKLRHGKLSDSSEITGQRPQDQEFGGKGHTLSLLSAAFGQWIPYETMDQGIPTVCLAQAGLKGEMGEKWGKHHAKKTRQESSFSQTHLGESTAFR